MRDTDFLQLPLLGSNQDSSDPESVYSSGDDGLNSDKADDSAPDAERNETVIPTITHTTQTYFILAPGAGRVKIGRSKSVKSRFAELSCASPEWLVLLGVLDGDREGEMHARFHRYHAKGEWFRLAGALREFVRTQFPDKLLASDVVCYVLDHEAHIGGVPGRVTRDYEPFRGYLSDAAPRHAIEQRSLLHPGSGI